MSTLTDQIATDVADCFLSTEDWGEAVTYTPSGGSATSINVIWDNSFETVSVADGVEIRNFQPACFASEDDITVDTDGDTIVRGGATYYVLDKQGEKGQGVVILLLSLREIHG